MQTASVVESHITLGYKDRQSVCVCGGGEQLLFSLEGWAGPLKALSYCPNPPSHCVFQRELRVMMLLENRCTFRACVYLGSGVKRFQRVCTRCCMCQCGLLEESFRCAIAQAQGDSFAASAKAQQKEGFSFVEFMLGSDSALILFNL